MMYSTPSGADQAIRQASTTHRHIPTTHPKRLQTTSPPAAFIIVVTFLPRMTPPRGSPSVTMNVTQDTYDAGIIFFRLGLPRSVGVETNSLIPLQGLNHPACRMLVQTVVIHAIRGADKATTTGLPHGKTHSAPSNQEIDPRQGVG